MPCSALFLCNELLCPSFIVMNSRRRLIEVMCERSLPLLTLCSVVAARCARRSDLHGRHANDFDMVEGANDDNESSTNLSLSLFSSVALYWHTRKKYHSLQIILAVRGLPPNVAATSPSPGPGGLPASAVLRLLLASIGYIKTVVVINPILS